MTRQSPVQEETPQVLVEEVLGDIAFRMMDLKEVGREGQLLFDFEQYRRNLELALLDELGDTEKVKEVKATAFYKHLMTTYEHFTAEMYQLFLLEGGLNALGATHITPEDYERIFERVFEQQIEFQQKGKLEGTPEELVSFYMADEDYEIDLDDEAVKAVINKSPPAFKGPAEI